MSVDWNKMEPQKYEDMISVLLSRLYPDAQRIDGRGGDGGRDVQIVDGQDGSLAYAFELKSFTDRMIPVRRRQVKDSLKRAASLEPARWVLVVPIDPTPAEDDWFRRLGKDYSFPIEWYGKTWLDEKMSAFPDIRRYFLDGAEHEVVRLLRVLREEQAIVTDVPDAIGRLRTLHERLNEIDPHYRYELSTGKDAADGRPTDVVLAVGFRDMRVDVYPKYSGATKDRPITVNVKILVDTDDEVMHAFDYGLGATIPPHKVDSVTVDAPFGLGGDFTETELVLIPINSLGEPVTLALDIMDGDTILASWPVHLTERTRGLRGSSLTGTDSTGWLQTRIKVDVETEGIYAKFWLTPQSAMPGALLPLLQWVDAFRPPHHLRFRWQGGLESRIEIRKPFMVDDSLSRVVEALAYLQKRCGIHWEMSPSLTHEEGQQILTAATMLKEETIDFAWESWSLRSDPLNSVLLKELMDGHSRALLSRQDVQIELEGVAVATVRIQTHLESVRLANPGAVERALTSGAVPNMKFVPGESDKGQRVAVLLPSPSEHL